MINWQYFTSNLCSVSDHVERCMVAIIDFLNFSGSRFRLSTVLYCGVPVALLKYCGTEKEDGGARPKNSLCENYLQIAFALVRNWKAMCSQRHTLRVSLLNLSIYNVGLHLVFAMHMGIRCHIQNVSSLPEWVSVICFWLLDFNHSNDTHTHIHTHVPGTTSENNNKKRNNRDDDCQRCCQSV